MAEQVTLATWRAQQNLLAKTARQVQSAKADAEDLRHYVAEHDGSRVEVIRRLDALIDRLKPS